MKPSSVYLIGLLMALFLLSAPVAHAASDDILNAKGKRSAPIETLPQWQRVIEDYAFTSAFNPSRKVAAWKRFLDSVENEPPVRQILKVNLWFNGFPYKQDNWIYGQEDYWASPSEFLENGGDCEDFVIIKYITLRLLGFSAEDMKIAMVYDVYSGTDHSLLIVNYNDEQFVLDNRDNMTVSSHYNERYKPHYVFNEKDLWTYDSPLIARSVREDAGNEVMPGNR